LQVCARLDLPGHRGGQGGRELGTWRVRGVQTARMTECLALLLGTKRWSTPLFSLRRCRRKCRSCFAFMSSMITFCVSSSLFCRSM